MSADYTSSLAKLGGRRTAEMVAKDLDITVENAQRNLRILAKLKIIHSGKLPRKGTEWFEAKPRKEPEDDGRVQTSPQR